MVNMDYKIISNRTILVEYWALRDKVGTLFQNKVSIRDIAKHCEISVNSVEILLFEKDYISFDDFKLMKKDDVK